MTRLQRLFPFLLWPRPDAALLRGEAMAGLTVALMVIPQGVAYAALAGMPLITGIYASLLPALVAALFSGSMRLSVGPTALTSLMVSASLAGLAEPGSPQWVGLAVWLSLLTGALQVALGFIRFGWLLNLISSPVLIGFTQAAAVLIIASQLPTLLGVPNLASLARGTLDVHWGALAFGLGSVALLLSARRLKPDFPMVLLVVVLAAMLSAWSGFEIAGGAVVGTLPSGLPTLYWPSWPDSHIWGELLMPVLIITLVSFLETASCAKTDNERAGRRWDQEQDLIGQGLGKIVSGLCGSFPTSSSFSRSALILYAGARTGWATVASVLVVLIALLFLTPVLRYVPQAVLAAIVITAVLGMLKPREFARLWRISRVEAGIGVVTFALTLATAPRLYWGVLAGILMALSHFLYQRLHPRIIEVGLHGDGSLRDRHLWKLSPLAPNLYALRMDAALDFASASAFERAITQKVNQQASLRHVCWLAQAINHIDATGVETFAKVRQSLQTRGITLHISGMKLPVERVLLAAGALVPDPGLRMYRTDAETLQALHALEPEDGRAGTGIR